MFEKYFEMVIADHSLSFDIETFFCDQETKCFKHNCSDSNSIFALIFDAWCHFGALVWPSFTFCHICRHERLNLLRLSAPQSWGAMVKESASHHMKRKHNTMRQTIHWKSKAHCFLRSWLQPGSNSMLIFMFCVFIMVSESWNCLQKSLFFECLVTFVETFPDCFRTVLRKISWKLDFWRFSASFLGRHVWKVFWDGHWWSFS